MGHGGTWWDMVGQGGTGWDMVGRESSDKFDSLRARLVQKMIQDELLLLVLLLLLIWIRFIYNFAVVCPHVLSFPSNLGNRWKSWMMVDGICGEGWSLT